MTLCNSLGGIRGRLLVLVSVSLPPIGNVPVQSPCRSDKHFEKPTCADCRWQLGTPSDLLSHAADSVWFGRIAGLAMDYAGRVLVADALQPGVTRVDPVSGVTTRFGRRGKGPGEFVAPFLVTTDRERVFVLDVSLRRLSVFKTTGAFERRFPVPVRLFSPHSVQLDGRGGFFLSGTATSEPHRTGVVHHLSTEGDWVRSFLPPSSVLSDFDSQMRADGGFLWWDNVSSALWFSRRGPCLEIAKIRGDGIVLNKLELGPAIVDAWSSPTQSSATPDGMVVRARLLLGTFAMVALPGGLLANMSLASSDGTVAVHVIRTADASLVAAWREDPEARYRIATGDDRGNLVGVTLEDELRVLIIPFLRITSMTRK